MKPEAASRRLFGITRSKGKMYELGLPEQSHIAIPTGRTPQELFLLTIATLGDAAAELGEASDTAISLSADERENLGFAASFFDAFLASRLDEGLTTDVTLLAASAYYIAGRPGSSMVLANRLADVPQSSAVDELLRWVLLAQWDSYPSLPHQAFGDELTEVAEGVARHFFSGSSAQSVIWTLNRLRRQAYSAGTARELLFIDLLSAICRMRLSASAWTTLPRFTQIEALHWRSIIRRTGFPKELWPSQLELGRAGMFSGESGLIQMPTSAGKTRAVEIILRSAFLSKRTRVAVVVAPFRALCHEIGMSLRHAFQQDEVRVNELSDALQLDFLDQIAELLGGAAPTSQFVLVLTPEKLLYVLRQTPKVIDDVGLVVYDEAHQFDSGSRGVTYELLLTEIKRLLPSEAQTVLVSAVIQNAPVVADWLIGADAKVVDGAGLLPTARSVAFASWLEQLGQLKFFESEPYAQEDYFVPRVIQQQQLTLRPRETKAQFFPEKGSPNDVSLYLALRLVPEGAVAIFCGRKDTAAGMAERVVDIYQRDCAIAPPAACSDPAEVEKLTRLLAAHFGSQSTLARAAGLGVFVHHGNTPHGIRLCVEHAMQKAKIRVVACTSTLAQGVNLPIRYLIVSSIYQAGERIKVRDFQNLIGRAGRAGMHTEGLIIFADPRAIDKRTGEPWRFDASVELLRASSSESTTSSLLSLLQPFWSGDAKAKLDLGAEQICSVLFAGEEAWAQWAAQVVQLNPTFKFDAKELIKDLRERKVLVSAIESYLMANRGGSSFEEFLQAVQSLASETLAYHISDSAVQSELATLFTCVAKYVQAHEPEHSVQARFARTLLGVQSARTVYNWVTTNAGHLIAAQTFDDILDVLWPLFAMLSSDKYFHSIEPTTVPVTVAKQWIRGAPYEALIALVNAAGATRPWGTKRRKLTDDDVVDLCEHTLGFECSLVLAAVAQFIEEDAALQESMSVDFSQFQKSIKYGLPDSLSTSCFERGFADRALAQSLCAALRSAGFDAPYFGNSVSSHESTIRSSLADWPSYFQVVLDGLK